VERRCRCPFIGRRGKWRGRGEAVAQGRWRPAPLMAAALGAVVEGGEGVDAARVGGDGALMRAR
jgi:hypothetical protein